MLPPVGLLARCTRQECPLLFADHPKCHKIRGGCPPSFHTPPHWICTSAIHRRFIPNGQHVRVGVRPRRREPLRQKINTLISGSRMAKRDESSRRNRVRQQVSQRPKPLNEDTACWRLGERTSEQSLAAVRAQEEKCRLAEENIRPRTFRTNSSGNYPFLSSSCDIAHVLAAFYNRSYESACFTSRAWPGYSKAVMSYSGKKASAAEDMGFSRRLLHLNASLRGTADGPFKRHTFGSEPMSFILYHLQLTSGLGDYFGPKENGNRGVISLTRCNWQFNLVQSLSGFECHSLAKSPMNTAPIHRTFSGCCEIKQHTTPTPYCPAYIFTKVAEPTRSIDIPYPMLSLPSLVSLLRRPSIYLPF